MNSISTYRLAVAALCIGMAGSAQAATIFTDRATFESLLASADSEDFESYSTYGTADPLLNIPDGLTFLDLDGFTLAAAEPTIKIWDAYHDGSVNTTSGGKQFLYLDTDIGLQGSTTAITLDNPVTAFGFAFTGVYEPGTEFTVTIGSETFSLSLNSPEDAPLFWGVMGLGSFSEITLYTSLDSGYAVDDMVYGTAVPLPPALWLFGSGLLALAGGTARRRTRS